MTDVNSQNPKTTCEFLNMLNFVKKEDRLSLMEAAKEFVQENKFPGVNKDTCAKKKIWRARYYNNGKATFIGRYYSKEEAILARLEYAKNLSKNEDNRSEELTSSYIPTQSCQV
jgi:hypothetical protein